MNIEKTVDIEVTLTNEELASLAVMAHSRRITLNELCVDILTDKISEDNNHWSYISIGDEGCPYFNLGEVIVTC